MVLVVPSGGQAGRQQRAAAQRAGEELGQIAGLLDAAGYGKATAE